MLPTYREFERFYFYNNEVMEIKRIDRDDEEITYLLKEPKDRDPKDNKPLKISVRNFEELLRVGAIWELKEWEKAAFCLKGYYR